jgi:hypothetical protein
MQGTNRLLLACHAPCLSIQPISIPTPPCRDLIRSCIIPEHRKWPHQALGAPERVQKHFTCHVTVDISLPIISFARNTSPFVPASRTFSPQPNLHTCVPAYLRTCVPAFLIASLQTQYSLPPPPLPISALLLYNNTTHHVTNWNSLLG